MIKKLLFMLVVTSLSFSLSAQDLLQQNKSIDPYQQLFDKAISLFNVKLQLSEIPFYQTKQMLQNENTQLSPEVVAKVMATLRCMNEYEISHKNILTIIDFSLPSNKKRLWVFDLDQKKLLFHTYVSHGIKSGALISNQFSNKYNSKASSIGVYKTEKSYYGRHGLSLKLDGIDRSFNDNAFNRFVVMHGSWYVNEAFIKRYGRPGRSWGCPSIPVHLVKPIVNTIKDDGIFVAYYPSDRWFLKSKFLNCEAVAQTDTTSDVLTENNSLPSDIKKRDDILFADINKNDRREQNEPIVVMTASTYEKTFHNKAPLTRMLRRQINKTEYIALSDKEFTDLISHQPKSSDDEMDCLKDVAFVIPVIIKKRGYYATEMEFVNLGRIKQVRSDVGDKISEYKTFTVRFKSKPIVILKASKRFIRWLGL